jgi:hypothetical protein
MAHIVESERAVGKNAVKDYRELRRGYLSAGSVGTGR